MCILTHIIWRCNLYNICYSSEGICIMFSHTTDLVYWQLLYVWVTTSSHYLRIDHSYLSLRNRARCWCSECSHIHTAGVSLAPPVCCPSFWFEFGPCSYLTKVSSWWNAGVLTVPRVLCDPCVTRSPWMPVDGPGDTAVWGCSVAVIKKEVRVL